MSAARTEAEVLPVVEAVRRPGRLDIDAPTWRVRRCPYCSRPHTHRADVLMTSLAIPAGCDKQRFYRVREVTDGGRAGV